MRDQGSALFFDSGIKTFWSFFWDQSGNNVLSLTTGFEMSDLKYSDLSNSWSQSYSETENDNGSKLSLFWDQRSDC